MEKKLAFVLVLLAGLGLSAEASAAKLVPKSGRLWLAGDSTLHPFSSTATAVEVSGESAGGLAGLSRLEVVIPVESLKSGEKGLDRNMYAALMADKAPRIVFHLTAYEASAGGVVRAQGTLSIAGAEKNIDLEAQAALEGDDLRLRGSKRLLMTDFGVKPPKLFLGAIKVRDPVLVTFDLLLGLDKS